MVELIILVHAAATWSTEFVVGGSSTLFLLNEGSAAIQLFASCRLHEVRGVNGVSWIDFLLQSIFGVEGIHSVIVFLSFSKVFAKLSQFTPIIGNSSGVESVATLLRAIDSLDFLEVIDLNCVMIWESFECLCPSGSWHNLVVRAAFNLLHQDAFATDQTADRKRNY